VPENGKRRDDESQKQRVDRELIELLNELRVALPGVQVLFAFLLTLPFTNRFEQVTGVTEAMYIVALAMTAAAAVVMIAPSAYHRLNFRTPQKERMLVTSNRLSIAGLVLLTVAMGSSLYVVVAFLYGSAVGGALAGGLGALMAAVWYGLPLWRRAHE
jgi:hypothetical protein